MKTLDEYMQATRRTATTEGDAYEVLALGIQGEAGELADSIKKTAGQGHPLDKAKLALELGDVLWYTARMADVRGSSLAMVAHTAPKTKVYGNEIKRFTILALRLGHQAGLISKWVDDGQITRINLSPIMDLIRQVAELCGFSVIEIAEMNQAKLLKRFPSGFSTAASMNRVDVA